jgi:hypothetical protein
MMNHIEPNKPTFANESQPNDANKNFFGSYAKGDHSSQLSSTAK